MNHAPPRFAVAVVFAGMVLTGCEGGAQTNGLEDKSAPEVAEAAAAAFRSATSVHVTGTGVVAGTDGPEGTPATIDFRSQNGSTSGTVTLEGADVEFIVIGDDAYIKGDQAALVAVGAPPQAQSLGADRWLQLGAQAAQSWTGYSIDDLADQLTTFEAALEPTVEQTTLNGERVVVISDENGSRLYVANNGAAYPLRGEFKEPGLGQVDFSEYDAEVSITVPENAVAIDELSGESGPLSAEELLWLQAIQVQRSKIDEAVLGSDPNLNSAVLLSLEEALRTCRTELAQSGSPSARLQPVSALVEMACAEYDKGAECFATAAGIGVPVAGSTEEASLTEAIECGFAAHGTGAGLLAEAEVKGFEIQQAAT